MEITQEMMGELLLLVLYSRVLGEGEVEILLVVAVEVEEEQEVQLEPLVLERQVKVIMEEREPVRQIMEVEEVAVLEVLVKMEVGLQQEMAEMV